MLSSNEFLLWPEGLPNPRPFAGEEAIDADGHISQVHVPTLTFVRPSTPPWLAVLICPGGAYIRLAARAEGTASAQRFADHGIAAFILKSRLVEYGQPAPLLDAQRALTLIRNQHEAFGFGEQTPAGVLGFSAGGHLAACLATMAPDRATRPDFCALLYPVISMLEPWAHPLSRRSLLGASPSAELAQLWSPELLVGPDTPPTFIATAQDDASVAVQNSVLYREALQRAGVPNELRIYPRGGHGFGLQSGWGEASAWPDHLLAWLRQQFD